MGLSERSPGGPPGAKWRKCPPRTIIGILLQEHRFNCLKLDSLIDPDPLLRRKYINHIKGEAMAKSTGAKIEKRINSKHIAVYHFSRGS
jgi:hypothetical protein